MGSRVREDGSGDSRRDGGVFARKNLPARKRLPAPGAMAIASVGVSI